jgi:hypothetical protein
VKRRILLDENVPHDLRHHLGQHETMTVAYAGFAGYKNGQLLDAAEAAGFDVLVTGDRTLHYEQNLSGRAIALVSLSAISWPVIEPHVAKIIDAFNNAKPGSFTRVDVGRFRRPSRKPKGIDLG